MTPVVLDILKLVAVPFVAAVAAAFLAVRRTKTETRWKAKYDAYLRILTSVEDIRYWADETYSDCMLLPSIGKTRLDAAQDRYEEAKRVLSSHVYVGGLVVCEAAQGHLAVLLTEIAREQHRFEQDSPDDPHGIHKDFAEHCYKIRAIANSHVEDILKLAKKDLR